MRKNNLLLILTAIILGIIISTYILSRVKIVEETQKTNNYIFLEEIQRHSDILKEWELDSMDMGLYPEQKEVFRQAIREIRLVQFKIRTNATLQEIQGLHEAINNTLKDAWDISDFRYVNWKESFQDFDNHALELLIDTKSSKQDYIDKIHSINNIRRRYLELLLREA